MKFACKCFVVFSIVRACLPPDARAPHEKRPAEHWIWLSIDENSLAIDRKRAIFDENTR